MELHGAERAAAGEALVSIGAHDTELCPAGINVDVLCDRPLVIGSVGHELAVLDIGLFRDLEVLGVVDYLEREDMSLVIAVDADRNFNVRAGLGIFNGRDRECYLVISGSGDGDHADHQYRRNEEREELFHLSTPS